MKQILRLTFISLIIFCRTAIGFDSITGTLEIRIATLKNQKEMLYYVLHSNDHEYHLHFKTPPNIELKSGMEIRIKAPFEQRYIEQSSHLYLRFEQLKILNPLNTAIPSAFGPQETAVFLVNFITAPEDKPWTVSETRDIFFNISNAKWLEFSYNQTSLVGDVFGYYTLPLDGQKNCDFNAIQMVKMTEAKAKEDGIDLSSYRHRVYIFPRNYSCPWLGLTSTLYSTKFTLTWFSGYNNDSMVGHELGHNLGLFHSKRLQCKNAPVEDNCEIIEYGDYADNMGGGGNSSHYNAFQKERLGWLNYDKSPPIQTVTTSGSYHIGVYETNNQDVKAIKIPISDNNEYYYIEYRQGIGFDKPLSECSDCDYTRGVLIHVGSLASPFIVGVKLLDMSPQDQNYQRVALLPGQTFTDNKIPNGGVSITLKSITPLGADLDIKFGA